MKRKKQTRSALQKVGAFEIILDDAILDYKMGIE